MKCIKCKKEIELGEHIYEIRWGTYKEDKEFPDGRYFQEAKSVPVHGYICYKCL